MLYAKSKRDDTIRLTLDWQAPKWKCTVSKCGIADSVTRFGEISPLWHYVKNFGHFERAIIIFANGQFFIAVIGQKLNKRTIHQVTLVVDYLHSEDFLLT